MTEALPSQFVAIDEDGFLVVDEVRITNEELGQDFLADLKRAPNGAYLSTYHDEPTWVEAFDEPLIAKHVQKNGLLWTLRATYGHHEEFELSALQVDEWDRFHGRTKRGIPFVLSEDAQSELFDQLDAFDDDSVTCEGQRFEVPPLYSTQARLARDEHWDQIYLETPNPEWNIGDAAPPLKDMLSRLKLIKSRILVLGCGEGHDAAFFAKEGHVVTAVDFSEEALKRAKKNYGSMSNIRWLRADVFGLGNGLDKSFDVIFDHTLYCAVDPARRAELAKNWWLWLAPGGHLMGVFFAINTLTGPPFGSTEWELRERLKKRFRFIFWGRWKASLEDRQGKELFVYAQKLEESR